jgi:hypothetical protein
MSPYRHKRVHGTSGHLRNENYLEMGYKCGGYWPKVIIKASLFIYAKMK